MQFVINIFSVIIKSKQQLTIWCSLRFFISCAKLKPVSVYRSRIKRTGSWVQSEIGLIFRLWPNSLYQ